MNIPIRKAQIPSCNSGRKPPKRPYDRKVQLPKLIGLWPHETEDCSEAANARIVALLRKALRGERQRGQGGHWTYNVNRHLALIEALSEERERLRILTGLTVARRPQPLRQRAGDRPHAEVLHLPFSDETHQGTTSPDREHATSKKYAQRTQGKR